MHAPRVLILYNEPVLPADDPDAASEYDVLGTVDAVSDTLTQAGFPVSRVGATHDPRALVAELRSHRPDVVFNLYEGTGDDASTEAHVAGLLEWLGLPFTGSPYHTLTLARNKHLTKLLLLGAGLPTPEFLFLEDLPVPECHLDWPVIVKPAALDASLGLDHGSVVTGPQRLNERVAHLLKRYGPPVLVEQFIRGREFNVALTEAPQLRTLPVSEIVFAYQEPGCWPIVTYDAKWKPGSRDDDATPPRCPADIAEKWSARLGRIASQAFRLLGCRDYARVDFRVNDAGDPFVLEVNPNPDFSPHAGFANSLTAAGMSHAQFTVDLVKTVLQRPKKPWRGANRCSIIS
jgi:D-alanine-D-alanine ligase